MRTIFWAGLWCGVLDITAALLIYRVPGGPLRLLQGIAYGWLGKATYTGGRSTAALGLFFHFLVAFGAATVYYLISRRVRTLVDRPLLWGPIYGMLVYFFMNLVVIPLSAIGNRPLQLNAVLIGLAIHVVCVGLPIALVVSRDRRTSGLLHR